MTPDTDHAAGSTSAYSPRVLIIGAGSRGNAYARAIHESGLGQVAAVAEPIQHKRRLLGSRYIWGSAPDSDIAPEQEFADWKDFIVYETARRRDAHAGRPVPPGIHVVFVCVLDEQHIEVVAKLAPFNLHIMCEKPLATSLKDCLSMYSSLRPPPGQVASKIFGIGHVLRYSPHNMLLRQLVLEDEVIGDVLSIEHTEPVGWWHYSHSYVRGNWRKESSTAPSLLTKSCHDIDWILWMLCSPPKKVRRAAHLPSSVSSTGSLTQFRKSRKPKAAGSATNCLSCPIESSCLYSAVKIYYEQQLLAQKELDWPVSIVVPEIESCYRTKGEVAARDLLLSKLGEDYGETATEQEIDARAWYGRCVWEAGNDVCDDQFVTLSWDDFEVEPGVVLNSKTATFHMIAGTEKQCERRGRIYGDKGEIEYDGTTIRIFDFATASSKTYHPPRAKGGHGGGDDGLVRQFLLAVRDTETGAMRADDAQVHHLGSTLEEVIRSHALVFAAEEARRGKKVVDWKEWWSSRVESSIQ